MKTWVCFRLFPLTLLILRAATVCATDYTWTGAVSSDWSNPANWSPDTGVPGVGDNVIVRSGSPVVSGEVRVARLELNGGTLGGSGVLTVTNMMEWTGGTMGGSGGTVMSVGSVLEVSGDGQKTLDTRSVTNLGTVVWSGGGKVFVQSGAPFWNEGLFEVRNDVAYEQDPWSGAGSFHNAGTLWKTGGSGTTTFQGIPVENTGEIGVWQGTVNVDSVLSLGPASILEIGIGGVSQSAEYGRITSSGQVELAGGLEVVLLDGYIPGGNERYEIIAAPMRGRFQSYSAPDIAPGIFVNPAYTATGVALETTDATPIMIGNGWMDASGQFRLSIQGVVNQSYAIEASTDLEEWTLLATAAIPASAVWEFADADSLSFPHRFYRVMYRP